MIAVGRNAGGGPQSEGEESEGEGEEGEGEGDYTVYECPGLASVTMRLFFKQGFLIKLYYTYSCSLLQNFHRRESVFLFV
jgi:hypothetical protein